MHPQRVERGVQRQPAASELPGALPQPPLVPSFPRPASWNEKFHFQHRANRTVNPPSTGTEQLGRESLRKCDRTNKKLSEAPLRASDVSRRVTLWADPSDPRPGSDQHL